MLVEQGSAEAPLHGCCCLQSIEHSPSHAMGDGKLKSKGQCEGYAAGGRMGGGEEGGGLCA